MKVRIGISLGPAGTPGQFADTVDLLEQAGVDSLWLSEITYSPLVEPFTGMAFALARTRRLKAGTGVTVLPGRNPVLVAKQLASLAGLAPGRVLPVFGVLPAQPAERVRFDVPDGRRAAVFDESLRLIRLLLTAERVSFDGGFFTVSDATVGTLPAKPLDIWLGGSAPAGLRRVGRLADGWLGSLLTPAEAGAAVKIIQEAAAEERREEQHGEHAARDEGIAQRLGDQAARSEIGEEGVEAIHQSRPSVKGKLFSPSTSAGAPYAAELWIAGSSIWIT